MARQKTKKGAEGTTQAKAKAKSKPHHSSYSTIATPSDVRDVAADAVFTATHEQIKSTTVDAETMPNVNVADKFDHSAECLTGRKRLREDEVEGPPLSSAKRAKRNQHLGFDLPPTPSRDSTIEDNSIDTVDKSMLDLDSTTGLQEQVSKSEEQELPVEVRHLKQNFEFSTMSILSSSKIESRVRNLLERIRDSGSSNTGAKPGIVILSANANVANKMCSIVEIAKSNIKQEKGDWWQYTRLDHRLLEVKVKEPKRVSGGKAVSKQGKDDSMRNIENGISQNTGTSSNNHPQCEHLNDKTKEIFDEDEETEDGFETMEIPNVRGKQATKSVIEEGKKVRNTAVMCIFFARVPIPDLKKLYGEQTSA